MMSIQKQHLKVSLLYGIWLISLAAMFGSLYLSEIERLTPCVLCWYQRICMYPLVVLIPAAIFGEDRKIYRYVFPLAIIGFAIAAYHTLLQAKIIPEKLAPCVSGISCATITKIWFGFLTIPMASALSFLAIIILTVIYRRIKE